MKSARALTITYLTPVSFASLNGSDKEADNISNIKKITRETDQFPYVSAQAIRRALRDQLAVMGKTTSEGAAATMKKGAATTQQDPDQYIDDDLFGYMGTEEAKEGKKGKSTKRTSPVRVSPRYPFTNMKAIWISLQILWALKQVETRTSLKQRYTQAFTEEQYSSNWIGLAAGKGSNKNYLKALRLSG